MKKNIITLLLFSLVIFLLLSGCSGKKEEGPVTLRFNIDPIGKSYEMNQNLAQEYEDKTGVKIELIKGPQEATERLAQYLQFLGAKSPDIDLYQVDVIWPGIMADHLIDLKPYMTDDEISDFFPAIVENNTIDGRLVCIPWFADAGILYYRKDLLEKYGAEAPKTWDDLEKMAKMIQEKERAAGNENFWGFVWQGKAFECLTCVGIELLVSHGGGHIVDPDGTVSINNPKAVKAMKRAAGWVDTISPPGVPTYAEEEARQLFQTGNALFMRNWPYAYSIGNDESSSIKGKFDICILPAGEGGNAAALGGWQVGVSKYSRNEGEAVKFAKWITSREIQKRRALEATIIPARPSLYEDPEIAETIEFIPSMKKVFTNAAPRPSTVTGEDYNEVSTIFFRNFNEVLLGSQTAEEAAAKMEKDLKRLLN